MPEPTALEEVGFAKPIPPADSIPSAVRALTSILDSMKGTLPAEAVARGDASSCIDASLWGPAWEGARTFREIFLVALARQTVEEWRKDVKLILARQPSFAQPVQIAKSLDTRLRVTLDFAFRFLSRRHVCLLADLLTLAFDAEEISADEFRSELLSCATRSPHKSAALVDAVLVGASRMHMYQPERVLNSTGARS